METEVSEAFVKIQFMLMVIQWIIILCHAWNLKSISWKQIKELFLLILLSNTTKSIIVAFCIMRATNNLCNHSTFSSCKNILESCLLSTLVSMFASKARSVFCRTDSFHYLLVSVFFNEKRALKTLERQSKYLYMRLWVNHSLCVSPTHAFCS